MRKHNGMRPQDVVILLEILVNPRQSRQKKEIGNRLFISQSEVSESLHRSMIAKLVSDRGSVYAQAFTEFLEHGFKYVFPVQLGSMTHGLATAHSHPSMKKKFVSQVDYVWPDFKGASLGLSVEPLYSRQVEACQTNPNLYKALALLDVLRVGRTREIAVALAEIKNMLVHDSSQ